MVGRPEPPRVLQKPQGNLDGPDDNGEQVSHYRHRQEEPHGDPPPRLPALAVFGDDTGVPIPLPQSPVARRGGVADRTSRWGSLDSVESLPMPEPGCGAWHGKLRWRGWQKAPSVMEGAHGSYRS